MSHYEVNYKDLKEPEKSNKAICDIMEFLGTEHFHDLTAMIKREYPHVNFCEFEVAVSFAGIQGFPALAWFNHCFPEKHGKVIKFQKKN